MKSIAAAILLLITTAKTVAYKHMALYAALTNLAKLSILMDIQALICNSTNRKLYSNNESLINILLNHLSYSTSDRIFIKVHFRNHGFPLPG